MSKMKMPEIDVIRFSESDVIVASGGVVKTLSITGIDNGTNKDASLTLGDGAPINYNDVYRRTETFTNAYNTYMSGIDTYGTNSTRLYRNSYEGDTTNVTIYNAFYREEENLYSWAEGSYIWNGRWEHSSQ